MDPPVDKWWEYSIHCNSIAWELGDLISWAEIMSLIQSANLQIAQGIDLKFINGACRVR
jgi:hypothetical protein